MSHASVIPLPPHRPLADPRRCPWCQRAIESLRRGIGHKPGCACIDLDKPSSYIRQDIEAMELRECGCPSWHVWSCWDNPYRSEE